MVLYSEHKIHLVGCMLAVCWLPIKILTNSQLFCVRCCVLVTYKNSHKFTIILCSIKIRKTLENTRLSRVLNVRLFARELSLAEFPYLFGDRRTLPKTLSKMTEMVLRFPLSFP